MNTERTMLTPTLSDLLKYAKPPQNVGWLNSELFEHEFGFPCYQLPWTEEAQARLTSTNLIDFVFCSDEAVTAELFLFDGKPFLVAEKYGDRTDYRTHIVDRDVYKEFAKFFLTLEIEQRLNELDSDHKYKDISLAERQGYIKYSQGDEDLSVHIMHPRSMGFTRMFDSHIATYEGQQVSFVRWNDPSLQSWQSGSEMVVVSMPDSTEKVIHGSQVAFALKPCVLDDDLAPSQGL